jgi:hypothetical protein
MPRTPKEDCEPDEQEKELWSEDQKRRQYYYDDAHGYEVYDPKDDEENESDAEDEPAL